MIIKNIKVFEEDGIFRDGELYISDGIFADKTDDVRILDGKGYYCIPGLVDIHFHGAMGYDFCDADIKSIEHIAAYEASIGVTSICPATMTLAERDLMNIMKIASGYNSRLGARLVGINMEGPFLSAKKKGAQAEEHMINCDTAMFERLYHASGALIKLVDIAPENNGAMEFIDKVKDKVVVSIAHTTADYDVAKEAIRRGARNITHMYNAMPAFNHRDPGVIGAAYDSNDTMVELICDGVHIHPAVIRASFDMFGHDRVIMISDSMRATGLSDGEYTLGGQEVFVRGNKATLADGTIAGSVTNLMDCVRMAVQKMDIPLETAVYAASANPAKRIGIYDSCGSLSVGKRADFLLLDDKLELKVVYIGGERFV